jgi:hypothetical protein
VRPGAQAEAREPLAVTVVTARTVSMPSTPGSSADRTIEPALELLDADEAATFS